MAKLGKTEYFDQVILALKDDDREVRVGAVEALGGIGDTRAVDPLIEALKDDDWGVRGRAALVLGDIGDTRAVEPLTYLASRDEESSVREAAMEALKKLEV